MANIWKQNQNVNEHPNRNNFDLSFQSHSTFKFGTLYPVFVQPVVPGDSFSIEAAFGLKFMPLVFPVQSRIRAHMHFFYVRNKNLWENWENWMQNLCTNDEHPHPYLDVANTEFTTGSIHDFLGVPTSIVANNVFQPKKLRLTARTLVSGSPSWCCVYYLTDAQFQSSISDSTIVYPENSSNVELKDTFPFLSTEQISVSEWSNVDPNDFLNSFSKDLIDYFMTGLPLYPSTGEPVLAPIDVYVYIQGAVVPRIKIGYLQPVRSLGNSNRPYDLNFVPAADIATTIASVVSAGGSGSRLFFKFPYLIPSGPDDSTYTPTIVSRQLSNLGNNDWYDNTYLTYNWYSNGFTTYQESGLNAFGHDGAIRLNALPYRAYESIYNAFYRNTVVDPLIISGEKVYNKYNRTVADGADTNTYGLFQRNYELDFLTSAFPSPQQGFAPMVGVSALGTVTVEDENGISTFKADFDLQGNSTGNVVATSPVASVEHARIVANMISLGFNINDFRGANAIQRILETTMRKGYKYIDFIPGHFGVQPKYNELDMPEFIGGFSRDVNVTTTYASADTFDAASGSGASLGDYVGNANCFGGTNSAIRHYCDDFGYIIGIMSIVPTPAYSQILPKNMICPTNWLDYYFPEMAQIGMQPITYEEVAPLQRLNDMQADQDLRLQDTFGYQRPNYDMVARVDEVHGDFRGNLRNYLINRLFATSPQLGHNFLAIDPDEVNEIFQNTNPQDDTVIGQLMFKVFAKRPVPRVHMPGLGR